MFCPSCHTKNQFFNKYCYNCGHRLMTDEEKKQTIDPNNDMDGHSIDPIDDYEIIDEIIHDAVKDRSIGEFDGKNKDLSKQDVDEEYGDVFNQNPHGDIKAQEAHMDDTGNPLDFDYYPSDHGNNLYDLENPFSYDPEKDQEFSSQMPLRRYQKDKPSHRGKKVLKTILSLMFIILGIVAIGLLIHRLGRGTSKSLSLSQSITVSSSVEELSGEEEKVYRIVFNTVNGQDIRFLDEIVEVVNGRAEFLVDENTLYLYNPEPTDEEFYEVNLDAIVTAPNLPDATERVTITLSPPYNYAPFTLIQPSAGETEFQGTGSKVSFQIEPGSKVTINGEDFTADVGKDGRFEKEFSPPTGEDLLVLDVRVSTSGYLDNLQQIILRKMTMNVPLEIEGKVPISSDEEWIEIRGTTDPEATLEADLDIFEKPKINEETGEFSLYVKALKPGYTPCQLKAKLGDKESSIEVVLDRNTGLDSYTSTAWEPDYDILKEDDSLHNGQHFVLTGVVNEILETGDKNIFVLGLQDNPDEKPVYIEFWGSFDYATGDRLRVFANRWGTKDHMPRFLSKYIYQ